MLRAKRALLVGQLRPLPCAGGHHRMCDDVGGAQTQAVEGVQPLLSQRVRPGAGIDSRVEIDQGGSV